MHSDEVPKQHGIGRWTFLAGLFKPLRFGWPLFRSCVQAGGVLDVVARISKYQVVFSMGILIVLVRARIAAIPLLLII